MKLFHISDLHLGKRIYEFSMLEEQRELLLEILRSIDEEQPQALLISGDIYDKPVPPTEAVKLLDDFLTEVSKRGLHTYLIAGNHDSAQRLEFGKEIFGRESIHISGSIGEGLAHVTETDEYGTVEIWLLPFFKPAHVNALLREEEASSYAAAAKLLLEREKIDFSKVKVEPLFEEMVDFDTFSKSDFRAVKVKACEAVKKSKKLLQFTLDDGTGTDRTILSGIHAYYEPEELVGKTLIAITNLPPRAMMGIESCGMLLSAIHEEEGEEKLHLLMVDNHIPAGAKLY